MCHVTIVQSIKIKKKWYFSIQTIKNINLHLDLITVFKFQPISKTKTRLNDPFPLQTKPCPKHVQSLKKNKFIVLFFWSTHTYQLGIEWQSIRQFVVPRTTYRVRLSEKVTAECTSTDVNIKIGDVTWLSMRQPTTKRHIWGKGDHFIHEQPSRDVVMNIHLYRCHDVITIKKLL